MVSFRQHEKKAVRILAGSHIESTLLEGLLSRNDCEYDYTIVGYFITVADPRITLDLTCHTPGITGTDGTTLTSYIVFLRLNKLTLECHLCDGSELLDEDYRDKEIELEIS
ncbi:MAG: hypothetical protein EOP04_20305 [Proteobacteria bacterium]|nr:MAG: hypothetical protein EOP04_20305 [Pseudomonadota bacterium]